MSDNENTFKKYFFDMTEMVKVLYEEKTSRLQGEISKPSKGEDSSPSSSSSSTTIVAQTPPYTPRVHGKTPLLKIDIKFELPMYNGEVNAKILDNWVRQLEFYIKF